MTTLHRNLKTQDVFFINSSASGLKFVKESVKPFDWTFTTDYKGTLIPCGGSALRPEVCFHVAGVLYSYSGIAL